MNGETTPVCPVRRLPTALALAFAMTLPTLLAWAYFVLDPQVMGRDLHRGLGYQHLLVLAWFVASAATVGGGLGSGLESDETIRHATYSQREEDRRNRLAHDRSGNR